MSRRGRQRRVREFEGVPCTIERYPAPARIADAYEETGIRGLSV